MKKILNKDKYYIYCRVAATQQNADEKLDFQLDILEKYAQQYNLNVIGVFGDIGRSYDDFEHMMKNIKYGDANCILVTDESKISRSPLFKNEIIEAFENGMLDKIRTRTTIYQNDPESKLQLLIFLCMADYENAILKKNKKKALPP